MAVARPTLKGNRARSSRTVYGSVSRWHHAAVGAEVDRARNLHVAVAVREKSIDVRGR